MKGSSKTPTKGILELPCIGVRGGFKKLINRAYGSRKPRTGAIKEGHCRSGIFYARHAFVDCEICTQIDLSVEERPVSRAALRE